MCLVAINGIGWWRRLVLISAIRMAGHLRAHAMCGRVALPGTALRTLWKHAWQQHSCNTVHTAGRLPREGRSGDAHLERTAAKPAGKTLSRLNHFKARAHGARRVQSE